MRARLRWLRLPLLVAVAVAVCAVAGVGSTPAHASGTELIQNGGFESGYPGDGFCGRPGWYEVGYDCDLRTDTIPGWTVGLNGVDWTHTDFPPHTGSLSIDLNGGAPGALSQVVATTVGEQYELTYWYSVNYHCGAGTRRAQVTANGLTQTFALDPGTAANLTDQGWWKQTLDFTAVASTTTVTFTSLSSGACGLALDDVSLVQTAPSLEPGTVPVYALVGGPSYNPSGVTIPAGEQVTVSASGTWDVCGGSCPSDPNGAANKHGSYLDPSAPAGELVGSLDGGATWFAIGAGPTTVAGPGTLILAANDYSTNFGDNTGRLTATVSAPVPIDTTPPVLTVPATIERDATGSSGAVVTYSATATDDLDPNPTVTCAPASGSTFGIGTTTVSCTAADASGNTSAAKTFAVVVSPALPSPGQAEGVASHVSNVQEQVATPATVSTSSPDFTGQPWFAPVTARGGQGHTAYGRFAGTDWLAQAVNADGNLANPHWSRYRASFDAPAGGMTVKAMADNAVTGVWVNGVAVGPCSRTSPCAGFLLPGTTIAVPDAVLHATGNTILFEVLDEELAVSTGAIDFEVVPQAPSVTPVVTGTLGSNGWYTSDVSVHWTVVHADSSSGCDDATVTSDPSGVTYTCSATNFGGTTTRSVTVKRDATPPSLTATPTTSPGPAGWYTGAVTIHWTCDDGTGSGVVSCPADSTISSEGTGLTVERSVSDAAGNSVTADSEPVAIDSTAPAISADAPSGWQSGDVRFDVTWSDHGSGPASAFYAVDGGPYRQIDSRCSGASCSGLVDADGDGVHTVTFYAVDRAGNVSPTGSATVQIDATPPAIAAFATADGAPYASGSWTNRDVVVHFSCSDAGSGVASVSPDVTLSGEGDGQSASGTCVDAAGNSAAATFDGIRIDKTAPALDGNATAAPNANGWYAGAVTIHWTCSDDLSGVASCPADSTIAGPGAGLVAGASVSDLAGNTTVAQSRPVSIDLVAPTTTASAPIGWQNTPALVTLAASDDLSGVATTYYAVDGGPAQAGTTLTVSDDGVHTISYWSVDLAGNVEAARSLTVKVDRTPPTIAAAATSSPNGSGWYAGDVTVHFTCSDAGSGIPAGACPADQILTGEGAAVSSAAETVVDAAGNTSAASNVVTVKIDRTDPTVAFSPNGGVYDVDQTVAIVCTASDALSGVASSTCADVNAPAWSLGLGTHVLSATAVDRAGNTGSGSGSYTVVVTGDGLCALVEQWVSNAGVANSLCAKLRAAAASRARGQAKPAANQLAAFRNELAAQSGKKVTAAHADTLALLSRSL